MKVAILTSGRFHLCDLARELDALGHDVSFYTLVPPWRTRRFGLPSRCHRWLAPALAPLLAAYLAAQDTPLAAATDRALSGALDRLGAVAVERCDVFVGMSGMCGHAAASARRRFGARVVVTRGSRHVLSQRQILEEARSPGAPPPIADWTVRRELRDYAVADVISVPSRHVVESFLQCGVAERRLYLNPYGVDLTMFAEQPLAAGPDCVLSVGAWSLQKGSDLLTSAWRRLSAAQLLHVGAVLDAPLPSDPGFTREPPVDQLHLPEVYRRGRVLALASRQDGFGMVLSQALACGRPVVCSNRTGGEDLREILGDDGRWVSVVPAGDVDALADALATSLASAPTLRPLGARREALSWAAYGQRYDKMLRQL